MSEDQKSSEQRLHHKFELQTTPRQAFLQIFNMHSKDGRIKRVDFQQILAKIGYKISVQDFNEVTSKIFDEKEQINFEEFLQSFKISDSQHDLREIRNAFRLIAGDNDKEIPLKRIIDLFKQSEMEEKQIEFFLDLLVRYIDKTSQMFNYVLFLSHLRQC